MKKIALWVFLSASGWLVSAILLFIKFEQKNTETAVQTNVSEPKECREAIKPVSVVRKKHITHIADKPERKEAPAQAFLMEVYVRPHPPAFTEGKLIKFTHYTVSSENGNSLIHFYNDNERFSVPAEAVEWPRQTSSAVYK